MDLLNKILLFIKKKILLFIKKNVYCIKHIKTVQKVLFKLKNKK